MKDRVLSGMRPTGKLHIGHLFGALQNYLELQKKYDCFFMIADWHALMSEYEDPKAIRDNTIDCAIDWLAVGIDPKESTIFIQSHVKEHLELHMALSVMTPLSWLERCPTYKEQLRELTTRDLTTYGFLGYPVLQAADILIYKAKYVPVGVDQLPHLEVAREIVRRFNSLYKKEILIEPEPILTKFPKILGTDNRKMSKSYDNYIALSDEPDVIRKKVMSMFTDPKRIKLNDKGHPEECNLYSYYKIFKVDMANEVYDYCTNAKVGCTQCKSKLAEVMIEYLKPIREKRKKFLEDKNYVMKILKDGAEKGKEVAAKVVDEVKTCMGMLV